MAERFYGFEDSRLKRIFMRLFQQPRCPHYYSLLSPLLFKEAG